MLSLAALRLALHLLLLQNLSIAGVFILEVEEPFNWSNAAGIGGRMPPESLAEVGWNTQAYRQIDM